MIKLDDPREVLGSRMELYSEMSEGLLTSDRSNTEMAPPLTMRDQQMLEPVGVVPGIIRQHDSNALTELAWGQ